MVPYCLLAVVDGSSHCGLEGNLMHTSRIAGAALAVTLSACAGRSPQPVAVVQPQDQFTDCTAIMAEVEANNRRVQELASEEGLKTTQNVAAGVAGIFIPVLWFGMDFQGAASKEVAALQSRQQYLASLAAQRCNQPAAQRQAPKR
jgi:hypothetical protein